MNPAELAGMLELLAQALRSMPAGALDAQAAQSAQSLAPQRTVADWLDVHAGILLTRGYKAQTLKNRRALLDHCRRLWGARAIDQIRPHEIATGLRSFPPARSSLAARVHAEVRDVFAEAIAADWCTTNPAQPLKPPKHKVKRARLTFATWQSMRTLAQAGPQRWVESMLLLALVTGQRRADLAAMRFDHIVTGEDGQQALRVEQQKQAGKGYGARLEIPLTLRNELTGMTLCEVIEHCRASAAPGLTLLRQANGRAIELSSLSARFCECIKAVLGNKHPGRHKRPSLHEARSLSARSYVAQRMDPAVVQTLLGHKDIEMTELYLNDRGLTAREWKRVQVAQLAPTNG